MCLAVCNTNDRSPLCWTSFYIFYCHCMSIHVSSRMACSAIIFFFWILRVFVIGNLLLKEKELNDGGFQTLAESSTIIYIYSVHWLTVVVIKSIHVLLRALYHMCTPRSTPVSVKKLDSRAEKRLALCLRWMLFDVSCVRVKSLFVEDQYRRMMESKLMVSFTAKPTTMQTKQHGQSEVLQSKHNWSVDRTELEMSLLGSARLGLWRLQVS